ncbi:hypothetical protein KKC52_11585 [bacterium]|nr:hypothetical protein [bacterium]
MVDIILFNPDNLRPIKNPSPLSQTGWCGRAEVKGENQVKKLKAYKPHQVTQHYGFTDEELDFIINYDIKYRMGKELDSGEEDEK